MFMSFFLGRRSDEIERQSATIQPFVLADTLKATDKLANRVLD